MLITDVYSLIVSGQCYEGLYQYHFLKNPDTIIPCLADGMPKVSSRSSDLHSQTPQGRLLRRRQVLSRREGPPDPGGRFCV